MAKMPKETRDKIARTVKQRWAEGRYSEHGHKVKLAYARSIAAATKKAKEQHDA
jgi:hypothetical protein